MKEADLRLKLLTSQGFSFFLQFIENQLIDFWCFCILPQNECGNEIASIKVLSTSTTSNPFTVIFPLSYLSFKNIYDQI